MAEKSCFNCIPCYDEEICTLLDDLIIGYCFMWQKRNGDNE